VGAEEARSGTEPTVRIVRITPAAAAEFLNANTNNRNLNPQRVQEHVKTIQSGQFKLLNDAVTIDWDGVIANGQHRLAACVETGQEIEVLLLTGVDPAVRRDIDTGQKRTLAQTLHMNGYVNTANLGSAATLHYHYSTNQLGGQRSRGNFGRERLQHALMFGWLAEHPEITVGVDATNGLHWHLPHLKKSAAAAFYALGHKLDPEAMALFYHRITKGEDLNPADPEYVLRNYAIRVPRNVHREVLLGVCIKAWNARRSGAHIQQLGLRANERFPVIV
jgi:hypothetical protein